MCTKIHIVYVHNLHNSTVADRGGGVGVGRIIFLDLIIFAFAKRCSSNNSSKTSETSLVKMIKHIGFG